MPVSLRSVLYSHAGVEVLIALLAVSRDAVEIVRPRQAGRGDPVPQGEPDAGTAVEAVPGVCDRGGIVVFVPF